MNRLQTLIGQRAAPPLRSAAEAAISSPAPIDKHAHAGFIAGLAAYSLWGFLPILFKSIHGVDSVTMVAERTLFSLVFVGLILLVARRLPEIRAALADRATRRSMLFSATLLGANWLIYVYAIESGQILETSFGYFINPLANVATGMLLLGERLNRLQMLAILIALVAIGIQAVSLNSVPIIALSIAGTFAAYGYFRKTAKVSSATGLFAETLLIAPFAAAYVAYTFVRDGGVGAHADPGTLGLLVLTGPATAVPLLLFAFAVQRLRMTTVGMLQYIAPSIAFLVAVFLYQEPLNPLRLLSFAIIWLSLGIYTADSLLRRRAAVPEAA